jgi:hypothetical protein
MREASPAGLLLVSSCILAGSILIRDQLAELQFVLLLVSPISGPPGVMQRDGLLVGENHLPDAMDVRAGDSFSCLREQEVIEKDHCPRT